MLSGGGFAGALIRRKDRETPGVCPVLFFVPNDALRDGGGGPCPVSVLVAAAGSDLLLYLSHGHGVAILHRHGGVVGGKLQIGPVFPHRKAVFMGFGQTGPVGLIVLSVMVPISVTSLNTLPQPVLPLGYHRHIKPCALPKIALKDLVGQQNVHGLLIGAVFQGQPLGHRGPVLIVGRHRYHPVQPIERQLDGRVDIDADIGHRGPPQLPKPHPQHQKKAGQRRRQRTEPPSLPGGKALPKPFFALLPGGHMA